MLIFYQLIFDKGYHRAALLTYEEHYLLKRILTQTYLYKRQGLKNTEIPFAVVELSPPFTKIKMSILCFWC